MAEIRHLKNRHDGIFFCLKWSDLDKIQETDAERHVDCGDVVEIETHVKFQYGGRLGEFNSMSSQSHVSEEVTVELLKVKYLPVLLYGLEVCPNSNKQFNSLDFVLKGCFRKIFRTRSAEVVQIVC